MGGSQHKGYGGAEEKEKQWKENAGGKMNESKWGRGVESKR